MPEVTITSADALKNFPTSANASATSVLTIKSIPLDPAVLLSGLAKCADSLEELRLEKVTLSGSFKKRATLPKLKTFYFHQVKANAETKEKLEDYLDGLDAKELLFFDKKAKSEWELEQIWDLKVNITLIVDGWKILDLNQDELTLTCMLPSSPEIVSNAPRELTKLALFDVEIDSDEPIPTSDLTHLTLYEVIFPDIPAVLKQCTRLESLSLYEEKDEEETKDGKKKGKGDAGGDDDDEDDYDDEEEEEEEDGDVDDWTNIELAELPSKSLKHLALGRARLSAKLKGAAASELDALALENCKFDQESLKLLKSQRILLRDCDPAPTATVLKRMTDSSSTQFLLMNGFNWEAKDTNKKKMNELLKASSTELYSAEDKFLLEKNGSKWKGRKFEDEECKQEQFKLFNWSQFCTEETWENMFQ